MNRKWIRNDWRKKLTNWNCMQDAGISSCMSILVLLIRQFCFCFSVPAMSLSSMQALLRQHKNACLWLLFVCLFVRCWGGNCDNWLFIYLLLTRARGCGWCFAGHSVARHSKPNEIDQKQTSSTAAGAISTCMNHHWRCCLTCASSQSIAYIKLLLWLSNDVGNAQHSKCAFSVWAPYIFDANMCMAWCNNKWCDTVPLARHAPCIDIRMYFVNFWCCEIVCKHTEIVREWASKRILCAPLALCASSVWLISSVLCV